MEPRIAITGAAGQLGTELTKRLSGIVIGLNRRELDITNPDSVQSTLDEVFPQVVINCAAYTQVDEAETDRETAFATNAFGPKLLASWCSKNDARLVHISTDYVFGADRSRTIPYSEIDEPAPINVYGESKLAGEEAIRKNCEKFFILRTCGLYRVDNENHTNFVNTMRRLAKTHSELTIIDDQICAPTSVISFANRISALLKTDSYGLYHSTANGECSWADFALEIFRLLKEDVVVRKISSETYGAKADRPAYSVLDSSKLSDVLGTPVRDWQSQLKAELASGCPS